MACRSSPLPKGCSHRVSNFHTVGAGNLCANELRDLAKQQKNTTRHHGKILRRCPKQSTQQRRNPGSPLPGSRRSHWEALRAWDIFAIRAVIHWIGEQHMSRHPTVWGTQKKPKKSVRRWARWNLGETTWLLNPSQSGFIMQPVSWRAYQLWLEWQQSALFTVGEYAAASMSRASSSGCLVPSLSSTLSGTSWVWGTLAGIVREGCTLHPSKKKIPGREIISWYLPSLSTMRPVRDLYNPDGRQM